MRRTHNKEEAVAHALLAYIERNYRQPIAPRDIAAALHYEPHHLAHVVRRAVGFSLGELIAKRRLGAAAQLLAETNISIGSIAARVGFRSLAYFSRKFSAIVGVSPSCYRRRARDGTLL